VNGYANTIATDSRAGGGGTIYSALLASARRDPDAAAIRDGGRTTTYGELLALADEDAGRLLALGLGNGDRAVLWLPNGARWASLFYACARLGVVVVTAGSRLRTFDLRAILHDSKARALFYAPEFVGIDYEAMVDELWREIDDGTLAGRPHLVAVTSAGSGGGARRTRLDNLLSRPLPAARAAADEQAVVCFTSGTTGRPKGCVHSHRALVRNGVVAVALGGFGPGDRILCPVPFAHVFGFHMGVLQAALAGATLVNAEPYDAERMLNLAESERATVIYAVPTMARELLAEQVRRPRALSALRLILVAGAPVPSELREQIADRERGLGALSVVYGCTEAPTLTQLVPGDPPMQALTSVGRPTDGVTLLIAEPGTVNPVDETEVGEVLARGYNEMLGYLDDPGATGLKYRDGWLVTGDLGWIDSDGYLHFVGRASEVFMVGGFNVHPRDVEAQLEQCKQVSEAAVTAVPDHRLGSVPMAWVTAAVPDLSEEQVLEWSRSNLAGYKRPRYARVVRSLPRTGSGKLSRVKLEHLTRRALPHLDWESEER
jgi:fatty-acyl-CoA synthase